MVDWLQYVDDRAVFEHILPARLNAKKTTTGQNGQNQQTWAAMQLSLVLRT